MDNVDNSKLMQIFGTEELVKAFEEINKELQTKILTGAFKEASKIIIKSAADNLGSTYNNLKLWSFWRCTF